MPLPRLVASVFLALSTAFSGSAADTAPANSTIWKLDQPQLVGGQRTSILGQPIARDDGQGTAIYFDGVDDGIFVPSHPLTGAQAFTIEVLMKPAGEGPEEQRFFHLQDDPGSRALLEIRLKDGQWALDTFLFSVESKEKRALLDRTKLHPAEVWTWVALVYADGHMTHYINGAKELEGDVQFPPFKTGLTSLGVRQNKVYWFKGGLREVRFHRSALRADQLQRAPSGAKP